MTYDLTYMSFGAGVQSTALLILAAEGRIPKPDVAIFADTGAELPATYEHVNRMGMWAVSKGIKLRVVTAGSLEHAVFHGMNGTKMRPSIPAFIKTPTGRGVQRRHCTYDFKMRPILRAVRQELGLATGQRAKGRFSVLALLGISYDEAQRMKPSREEWITHSYPLVDLGLRRMDCVDIIRVAGITVPPRSACRFCPFHRETYWRWLRDTHPDQFRLACDFDEALRNSQPGLRGPVFLLDSLEPLRTAKLGADRPERGFGNECEGHCGV